MVTVSPYLGGVSPKAEQLHGRPIPKLLDNQLISVA